MSGGTGCPDCGVPCDGCEVIRLRSKLAAAEARIEELSTLLGGFVENDAPRCEDCGNYAEGFANREEGVETCFDCAQERTGSYFDPYEPGDRPELVEKALVILASSEAR